MSKTIEQRLSDEADRLAESDLYAMSFADFRNVMYPLLRTNDLINAWREIDAAVRQVLSRKRREQLMQAHVRQIVATVTGEEP